MNLIKINGESISSIREIVQVNDSTSVGITTNGDMYSLITRELVNLGSPIVSAYGVGMETSLIIVLLKNGRLRLVHVDESNQLVSLNSSEIDREIPHHAVMMTPIPDSTGFPYWLVATIDNQLIVITIGELYVGRQDQGPHLYYLEIDGVVKTPYRIDYRDIASMINNTIVMNDGIIYSIKGQEGRYELVRL